MDKGVFFLIIGASLLWLVFDDFFGNQYISKMAVKMTPSIQTPLDNIKDNWNEGVEEHKEKDPLLNEFEDKYGPI